jgi:magnesium transporter
MIRVFYWQASTAILATLDADFLTASQATIPDGDIIWIDLSAPSPDEECQVFGTFLPVHPLTLEDITRPRRLPDEGAHLAKVEEFDASLFVIVNPLPRAATHVGEATARRWRREQLSAIITDRVLITHHLEPLGCIEFVAASIARHQASVARGPDYLFHLILDAMVDEYAPVVERITGQLSRIESSLFTSPSRQTLARLLKLKRRIVFLRKSLVLEREVLARLVRGEFGLVREDEIHYYRNVYDHLVRYTELIESGREMATDLMQLHMAATSNRMNEVMKVLTMISTIVLPMTLVAGIYGMNFDHMPELRWTLGYPFALALMMLVGVGALAHFRLRRWL